MMLDQRAEQVGDLSRNSGVPVAGALLMVASALFSIDRTLDRFIEILPRDEDGYIDLGTNP